ARAPTSAGATPPRASRACTTSTACSPPRSTAREARRAAEPSVSEPRPGLERRLGAVDAALLTIGSVVGTGIFLTGGEVARALPSAGAILTVWIVGGLLSLAGA